MTQREFELTVNILISRGSKLMAIKFIHHCVNTKHHILGLKPAKDIVDKAQEGINNIGVPFRIEHYAEFDKKFLNKLRSASFILALGAIKNNL